MSMTLRSKIPRLLNPSILYKPYRLSTEQKIEERMGVKEVEIHRDAGQC